MYKLGIDASNLRSGGGFTHLKEILKNIDCSKYSITKIIVWGGENINILKQKDVDVIIPRSLCKSYFHKIYWRLFKSEKEFLSKCDFLYVPGGIFYSKKIRYVSMCRNMLLYDKIENKRFGFSSMRLRLAVMKLIQYKSFKFSQGVIFISDYAIDELKPFLNRFDLNYIKINHGVSHTFSYPLKNQCNIRDYTEKNPFRILYVSTISVYKHHENVVKSIIPLLQKNYNITVDFVGDYYKPSLKRLNRLLNKHYLYRDKFRIWGNINHDEIHKFYSKADCFLFASSCENMPNILNEAMKSSLPIISSNMGPMKEFLKDSAFYFNPLDVQDMNNQLISFLDSPDQRTANALRASNYIKDCSWEKCRDTTFNYLTKVSAQNIDPRKNTFNGILKTLRYVRIYGFGRTFIKIIGRIQIKFPLSFYLKFPSIIKKGKKIAIIGCGHHTFSSLVFFISKFSNANILWAYDINEDAQKKLIKTYNISNNNNFRNLEDCTKPDLVYIASNHSTHTKYALKYLKMGCDVYIEKPIAVSFDELKLLNDYQQKNENIIYAGYNRPFSKAINLLKLRLSKYKDMPMSINYFVIGHKIPFDHWYRDEGEGTRIIGNLGHWIDLTVNLLLFKREFPKAINIAISYSDSNFPSENISITLTTPQHDLVSIVFSAREDPFEGVSESINFQCGDLIARINDFRNIQIWDRTKYIRKSFFHKDCGHKQATLQPFNKKSNPRPWSELRTSTSLMLYIEDMVKNGKSNGEYTNNVL